MDLQMISVAVTVGAAVLGLLVAFGRMALGQFERRIGAGFEQLQAAIAGEREQVASIKRQVEALSQALPVEYVRREDWLRFSSVIDNKLDRLSDQSRADSNQMRAELHQFRAEIHQKFAEMSPTRRG